MFQADFTPFITWILIAITILVSAIAFQNESFKERLIFYPPAIGRGEWYRLFTSGLIHGDLFHLVFNMYAFYSFGGLVEHRFTEIFHEWGHLVYLILYVAALPASDLPSYNRHRNDYYYRSLGASGAVAAVIFASIMLAPTMSIGFIFFPAGIPGFIFGVLYIGISSYLDRRGGGRINHSAHLWGALFGVAFMIVAGRVAQEPIVSDFIDQIRNWSAR